MTEHGEPYEGERKKGKMTAKAKAGGLDPVGKEDKDVDNDGIMIRLISIFLRVVKQLVKQFVQEQKHT